jgi:hypothetical protein
VVLIDNIYSVTFLTEPLWISSRSFLTQVTELTCFHLKVPKCILRLNIRLGSLVDFNGSSYLIKLCVLITFAQGNQIRNTLMYWNPLSISNERHRFYSFPDIIFLNFKVAIYLITCQMSPGRLQGDCDLLAIVASRPLKHSDRPSYTKVLCLLRTA